MSKNLKYILSERKVKGHLASYQTVYEWEDIILRGLGLSLRCDKNWHYKIYRRFENNNLVNIYHSFIKARNNLNLRFLMGAHPQEFCVLNCNTIPVIIDFWLSEDVLNSFYNSYRHSPLVLITSAEAFEYLKQHHCPLPIEHWPLSLPDTFEIGYSKKIYDFCFIGRTNPFFMRMVERYSQETPDFIYIISQGDTDNREFYTNKGDFIAKDKGRESYMDIIRKSKITVYTTPGLDEAKVETSDFNQVTPRVLEMIAGGCYVISHYPDNPDTRYYALDHMTHKVESYDEFKAAMDYYRLASPRDISECRAYIARHNTTSRISLLENILKKHNITHEV